MNRRTWFGTVGAAAMAHLTGIPLLGTPAGSKDRTCPLGPAHDRLERIGLQLYTVREALARDFEGTLAQVAAIGYREVEFAGYFGHPPAAVREALARAGLEAPSAHVPFEALGDAWPTTIADARAIGHRYVVVPWIPEPKRQSLAGYREVAAAFNRAALAAARAGLRFAYHNHQFEFQPLEGRIPYDVLLEATDPQLVNFELDLYWITAGGGDPLAYLARYPGRFTMLHLKDRDATARHEMTEVGSGTLDFAAILRAAKRGGLRHAFVEHDNPASPFDSIRRSFTYLERLEF
jgi:sugar phosphate isomerase/epimerase